MVIIIEVVFIITIIARNYE